MKINEQILILHFGELWLRGKNRGKYISRVIRNITKTLSEENYLLVYYYDRVLLRFNKDSNIESIEKKINYVFGLSAYELAVVGEPTIASIKKISQRVLSDMKLPKGAAIKITSHRSFKGHSFDSIKIISELSSLAIKKGIAVSNHNYSKELSVNVTKEYSFVFSEKKKGAGGLPVGSSGNAIILLSGGIDSPVAAWYAMKRGLQPIFVHIHGYSSNEEAYNTKIKDLYEVLSLYATKPRLYLFPSSIFQLSALKLGRSSTVVLKSFMLQIADKIAEKEHSNLIYTGESLGQVSSQTSSNILAESYGIKRQILRPLIGFDKNEIIKIARVINTFDISIKEYKDVCSINSTNASTSISLDEMKRYTKDIGIKKLVSKTLKTGTIFY